MPNLHNAHRRMLFINNKYILKGKKKKKKIKITLRCIFQNNIAKRQQETFDSTALQCLQYSKYYYLLRTVQITESSLYKCMFPNSRVIFMTHTLKNISITLE